MLAATARSCSVCSTGSGGGSAMAVTVRAMARETSSPASVGRRKEASTSRSTATTSAGSPTKTMGVCAPARARSRRAVAAGSRTAAPPASTTACAPAADDHLGQVVVGLGAHRDAAGGRGGGADAVPLVRFGHHQDLDRPHHSTLCGSTSTARRRSRGSFTSAAALAQRPRATRSGPLSQICQRVRPRSRAMGASAGPRTRTPGPGHRAGPRRRVRSHRAHLVLVRSVQANGDHTGKRRVLGLLPPGQLTFHEALVVVGAQALDGGVLGVVGLHQHPPRPLSPPGPPCHLLQQLKGALGGAEVG